MLKNLINILIFEYNVRFVKKRLEKISLSMLVDIRDRYRKKKNWEICDLIRDHLDKHLIFIIDTPDGQEVHYRCKPTIVVPLLKVKWNEKLHSGEEFIRRGKEAVSKIEPYTRKHLLKEIQSDVKSDKVFKAWLFSTLKSCGETDDNAKNTVETVMNIPDIDSVLKLKPKPINLYHG
jgi:hypothetical protein